MSVAMEERVEARLHAIWKDPGPLMAAFGTVDHKKIGKRYLVTAFAFLLIGGIEAALMRLQLAGPNLELLSPESYNRLFTMHGTTMIFLYAQPILSGFANYLVPMMSGARDLAFPRLNAFSYWVFLLAGIFLYASFLAGEVPDGGWFGYVPLTEREFSPDAGIDFYALGLLFLTVSTTAGAINLIVSILKLRAPGMSMNRMPLMFWSTLTTSVATVFALPALSAALILLELDRGFGWHVYDAAHGGNPLLWQHFFWIFGHPWVYIVFLPATGMVSMIIPTFARRTLVGYPFVALATVATGIIGFGVWVHHMFTTGLPQFSLGFFGAASMAISILSGIQVFAWLATIWYGRVVWRTPMLFMVGFLVNFVVGGLSGVMLGVVPFDWQVHDSYFVVAHFHYVLIGANLFPVLGAFYYWLPKITGRMMSERLGRLSFWLTFVGFNVAFFPMHISGLLGMRRRVYSYPAELGVSALNLLSTIGAAVLVLGIATFLVNVIRSRRSGAPAGNNPWRASTLEWDSTSPPPVYGVTHIPTVRSRDPLWDTHDEEADPHFERVLDNGRETMITSVLDARPLAIAKMPDDSVVPLLLALSVAVVFTGLILKALAVAALGLVLVAMSIGAWLWDRPQDRHPPVPEES